ncbi:MAG: c-type cytochrome [Polyangiaceae bacterium]
MKRSVGYLFACGALATLLACGKSSSSGSGDVSDKAGAGEPTTADTTTTAAADPKAAEVLFQSRCVACHGAGGHGDGPGSVALNPKPRNYTDAAWQSTVTDEEIKKAILYGGAAVGKSPNMPANPDLDGKPELDGLVKIVRGFKGK